VIEAVMQALQAGGNLAMIAVAIALWRFDRRLLTLEIRFDHHERECKP